MAILGAVYRVLEPGTGAARELWYVWKEEEGS